MLLYAILSQDGASRVRLKSTNQNIARSLRNLGARVYYAIACFQWNIKYVLLRLRGSRPQASFIVNSRSSSNGDFQRGETDRHLGSVFKGMVEATGHDVRLFRSSEINFRAVRMVVITISIVLDKPPQDHTYTSGTVSFSSLSNSSWTRVPLSTHSGLLFF